MKEVPIAFLEDRRAMIILREIPIAFLEDLPDLEIQPGILIRFSVLKQELPIRLENGIVSLVQGRVSIVRLMGIVSLGIMQDIIVLQATVTVSSVPMRVLIM